MIIIIAMIYRNQDESRVEASAPTHRQAHPAIVLHGPDSTLGKQRQAGGARLGLYLSNGDRTA